MEEAELAGSGTLVRINNDHAVLTASHVVKELKGLKTIGVVQCLGPKRFLSIHLPTIYLNFVSLHRSSDLDDVNPPDIALIDIPPAQIGTINARSTFYSLSKRQDYLLDNPPAADRSFWVIAGLVDEWTECPPIEHPIKQGIRIFNGMIIEGDFERISTESKFDLYALSIPRHPDYNGPKSFEGYSGGGLWQIVLNIDPKGSIILGPLLLQGVAYHQTGFQGNNINRIRCNGPICLYRAPLRIGDLPEDIV